MSTISPLEEGEEVSNLQWPIQVEDISSLTLDVHNVRVREGRGEGLTQETRAQAEHAIAKYMAEAEDLFDLIHRILRDGYLDNEIPVVVPEGGDLIVAEGNRRITALKVIAKPSLLGSSMSQRVDRLKTKYPESDPPNSIRVMIAPSREAVQPLLARLHTGQPKKAWIREQQAIFYHGQLSSDVTVDDLKARYPSEAQGIPKKIRMGEMREVIRNLEYDDEALRDFVMNSDLKMTVFEYAYSRKRIQSALGLVFTQDGLLVSKEISDGQKRGLIYLLQRFKEKSLNTRSPELMEKNAKEHEAFAELLRRIVAGDPIEESTPVEDPDENHGSPHSNDGKRVGTSGERSGEPSDNSGDAGDAGNGTIKQTNHNSSRNATNSRGPNRGETKPRLSMIGFEYQGSSAGLRRRFEELRRLNVRDFPNASHDLLRTVLECSIKEYFRSIDRPLKPRETLGGCVKSLANEYKNDTRMTTLINSINRRGRLPADQFAGTTPSLNASNHEPDHFATSCDVHSAWDRIKPILVEIVGTKPVNDGSDIKT